MESWEEAKNNCQISDNIMGVLMLYNMPLLSHTLSLFQPEKEYFKEIK